MCRFAGLRGVVADFRPPLFPLNPQALQRTAHFIAARIDFSTPRNFFRFRLRESSAGLICGVTENIVQAWALVLRPKRDHHISGNAHLDVPRFGVGSGRDRIFVALVVINLREITPFTRDYRNSAGHGSGTAPPNVRNAGDLDSPDLNSPQSLSISAWNRVNGLPESALAALNMTS